MSATIVTLQVVQDLLRQLRLNVSVDLQWRSTSNREHPCSGKAGLGDGGMWDAGSSERDKLVWTHRYLSAYA